MGIFAALLVFQSSIASADESEALFQAAPEDCLLYTSWAKAPKADPSSTNHTLRMLAEPEVQTLLKDLPDRFKQIIALMTKDQPESQKQATRVITENLLGSLASRPGCMFVESVKVDNENQKYEVNAALIFDAGSNANKLAVAIASVLKSNEVEMKPIESAKGKFVQISVPEDSFQSKIVFGYAEEYLMLCVGKSSPDSIMKSMAAGKTPAWLTQLKKRMEVLDRHTLSFLNVAKIRSQFLPMMGKEAEEFSTALGFDEIESIESATGLDDIGSVNRTVLRLNGEPKGVLSLFNGKGLKSSELKHLPADSLFAVTLSLDPKTAVRVGKDLIRTFDRRALEEMEREFTNVGEELELNFETDIINNIGSTWTLHNGSGDGWFSGLMATVDLTNAERLNATLQKFLKQYDSAPKERMPFRITKESFAGKEIYSLSFVEDPIPVRPSWCITDDRLIVTLFPESIRPVLKKNPIDKILMDKSIGGENLAMEFKRSFGGTQATSASRIISFTYSDTPKQFSLVYPYIQLLAAMAPSFVYEMGFDRDQSLEAVEILTGLKIPSARSIHRHLKPSTGLVVRTADGIEFEARTTFPGMNAAASAPVAIALLLPAVQQARAAARRIESANNLRQIAIASHNFHDTFKGFPAAYSMDEKEKPLLSWRVHLLPFIEENALYQQFRLDEPWDSDHNKKLISKMPRVYQSPVSAAGEGKTVYMAGPVFTKPKRGVTGKTGFEGIRDGASNTIMALEVNDDLAVVWTKPDVFQPDFMNFKKLFNYPSGTNVTMCDASVNFLSNRLTKESMRQGFDPSDGGPDYGWMSEGIRTGKDRAMPSPRPVLPQAAKRRAKESVEIDDGSEKKKSPPPIKRTRTKAGEKK